MPRRRLSIEVCLKGPQPAGSSGGHDVTGAAPDVHEARREGTSLFHRDVCNDTSDIYMQGCEIIHVKVLENP